VSLRARDSVPLSESDEAIERIVLARNFTSVWTTPRKKSASRAYLSDGMCGGGRSAGWLRNGRSTALKHYIQLEAATRRVGGAASEPA
jgi:hypothetical protein